MGTTVTALVLGTVAVAEMESLGEYGAQKVLHVADSRLDELHARAYAGAVDGRGAKRRTVK
jgi:electron transfer flavoprotein alpha subunit